MAATAAATIATGAQTAYAAAARPAATATA